MTWLLVLAPALSGLAAGLVVLWVAHLADWFAQWVHRRRVERLKAEDIRAGGGGW